MKLSRLLVASCSLAALLPIQAHAQSPVGPVGRHITFDMVVSAGAATCLPKAKASVVDQSIGPVEILTVSVSGLPPKTDFAFFIIQVPKAPFGLAWYQGDIQTGRSGSGVGRFIGRFSVGTFIVSLGAVPSVNEFPSPPAVLPQDPAGVAVDPVQIYHLGLWFDKASDAVKAGCPGTATTFNSEHNAGIQVLNTANFPDGAGPLINLP